MLALAATACAGAGDGSSAGSTAVAISATRSTVAISNAQTLASAVDDAGVVLTGIRRDDTSFKGGLGTITGVGRDGTQLRFVAWLDREAVQVHLAGLQTKASAAGLAARCGTIEITALDSTQTNQPAAAAAVAAARDAMARHGYCID